jgi:cytochrome c-type biogenesis protein CcmH
MRALRAAAVAILLLALPPAAFAEQRPMGQREVEEGLTCQCGCGLTVASCNHLECSSAVPARKKIAESLAAGESGEQILEDFRKEYGEKVLSSPVAEGFNMMAWIAPYLGIFLAGAAMFVFFRRRAGQSTAVESIPVTAAPASAASEDRKARLRDEMKELER